MQSSRAIKACPDIELGGVLHPSARACELQNDNSLLPDLKWTV